MGKTYKNFGIRLRALRSEHGLTQGELAKLVKVSEAQVGRYESGGSLPREDTLERLAQVLSTTPEYLLGGGWQEHLLDGLPTTPQARAIGAKLRELRGDRDARDVAKAAGIPYEHVIWYERGVTTPSPETAQRLAQALACEVDDFMAAGLATELGLPRPRLWNDEDELGEDYVVVPFYRVEVSAGDGATALDSPAIKGLAFRQDWVHRKGLPPSSLRLVTVVGDSMDPTLSEGDTVMVCTAQTEVRNAGLYIIRIDGDLMVKRLQRLPGNRIAVHSDNPSYAPYEIDLGHPPTDFQILGRVVWIAREL